MADHAPKMGKKFFGYDRASVERMLLERDAMLKVAERRVQSSEARAVQLEERLEEMNQRARKAEAAEAAAVAAAHTATPAERPEDSNASREGSASYAPQELEKAVTAAEASASQIIEAWMSTREQIAQADKLWRAVQEEVVRFAAWRDDVEPLMDQVQGFIRDARARIEEVPSRVQHALAPAVDAMVTVSEGMSKFAEVSTVPLLPSPLRAAPGDHSPEGSLEPETAETARAHADGAGAAEEAAAGTHGHNDEEALPDVPPDPAWDGDGGGSEAAQVDRLAEAAVAHGPLHGQGEDFEN